MGYEAAYYSVIKDDDFKNLNMAIKELECFDIKL